MEISYGDNNKVEFCGYDVPYPVEIETNALKIIFSTNEEVTNLGFELQYYTGSVKTGGMNRIIYSGTTL